MKFRDAQQEKIAKIKNGQKVYHFQGIWADGSKQSFIFSTLKEAADTKRNLSGKPTMWSEIK